MGQIGNGLGYCKSVGAILKILEFVILLIAIGCVGYFLDNTSGDFKKKGNLQFFMFAVVVGWLLVICLFTLFVTSIHDKVSAVNWPLLVGILSAVWAVLLLIASALVAAAVDYYEDKNICDVLTKYEQDARCGQLIGGAVCGFIAMVLFAIDAFLHFHMFMTKGSATQVTAVST